MTERVTGRPGETIARGFKQSMLEDGTTVLAEPHPDWAVHDRSASPGCAGLFGLLWSGVAVFALANPSGWEAGVATPFLLVLFFLVPGVVIVLLALRALVFERLWLVRGGEIAWHSRVRVLNLTIEGEFRPVERLEIHHGVWKTGKGSTDTLRFSHGAKKPTVIDWRERWVPEPPGDEARAWDEGGGVDAGIRDLGKVFADLLGRKLQYTRETIEEPSQGD